MLHSATKNTSVRASTYPASKMNRFLLATLVLSTANAYPDGAPTGACFTLQPQHGVTGQTTLTPYGFVPVNNGGGTYKVQITDKYARGFRGFIIQARKGDSSTPVGTFTVVPADAHTLDCTGVADTVTHSVNKNRTSISFTWSSGGASVSGVVFHGAVVQVKTIYWTGIVSMDLSTLP